MIFSRRRLSFGPLLGVSMTLTFVALAACSSSTATSTPAGSDAAMPTPEGGSAPETGVPDAGADTSTTPDAGGACNTVVNGAAVVPETAGVGAKPTPAGGTIADGTYFLTKTEVFAPLTPGAAQRKRTIKFSGGNTFESRDDDPGAKPKLLSGTFTTSGSNMTFNVTCPITASTTIPYTATTTTWGSFSTDRVDTGTKQ